MKIFAFIFFLSASCFAQEWEAVGGGVTSGTQIRDIWVDTLTDETYVAGDFWEMGGVPSRGVAKWNGTTWIDMCPECSNNQIYSILKYHDTLYISGIFSLNGIPSHAARFNGATWESIADDGNLFYLLEDSLYLTAILDDTLNGMYFPYMALWENNTWVDPFPVNNFCDEPLFSEIAEMIYYNGHLIIGGNFDFETISEITRYDSGQWSTLDTGLFGDAAVHHMVVYKNNLFIGGRFFDEAGNTSDYLTAWNGREFFNPFPDVEFTYNVRDLQVINDELYIVSQYNYVNDPTTYFFAKFDGENFCSFGGSFPTIFDVNTSPPKHIRELNGDLYVVCSPMLFNDTVNRIAHWTGTEMDTCVYSPVSALQEKNLAEFQLHPNPSNSGLTLGFNSSFQGTEVIHLVNQLGQPVLSKEIQVIVGANEIELELESLAKGIYVVALEHNPGYRASKWVKL